MRRVSSHVVLDAAPLLDAIAARGGLAAVLHVRGVTVTSDDGHRWARAYYRMRQSGLVTTPMADRWCIAVLGVHPIYVFGREWTDVDQDDAEELACST